MWTPDTKASRRTFLRSGVAGAALTTLAIPLYAQAQPVSLDRYAPEFFSAAEWAFVMAATARLIPSDGDGPGAIEVRVPVFIDRQMAGDFGAAADWYMEGPHEPDADPKLGYQSPLTPAGLYRAGIEAFDIWCAAEHGGVFAELDNDSQDIALTALEAGETGLPPEVRDFFDLLLQNTKEGYFADPMYGGNHGMAGWVYIGFPGARANFLEWTDPARDNMAYRLGPVSISGERA